MLQDTGDKCASGADPSDGPHGSGEIDSPAVHPAGL